MAIITRVKGAEIDIVTVAVVDMSGIIIVVVVDTTIAIEEVDMIGIMIGATPMERAIETMIEIIITAMADMVIGILTEVVVADMDIVIGIVIVDMDIMIETMTEEADMDMEVDARNITTTVVGDITMATTIQVTTIIVTRRDEILESIQSKTEERSTTTTNNQIISSIRIHKKIE